MNQSTSAISCNIFDDEENLSDRRIRILTPSSDILKTLNSIKRSNSEESNLSKDPPMILTSTCLDDDQMVNESPFSFRLNSFSSLDTCERILSSIFSGIF